MTKLLNAAKPEDIRTAGVILQEGGLVAIPTETVYGLAADALNPGAVRRIFETKGRPADNPLIVHIASGEELSSFVTEIPETAVRLIEAFWPGPLTLILQKSDIVPDIVSGGLDTVAVQLPANETARAVIRAAGRPLAAPSANISGRPSPTEFHHVRQDLMGKVDAIMDGGKCSVGVESTVLSLTGDVPTILRPGGVTKAQLEAVVGFVALSEAVSEKPKEDFLPQSPGMKYTHYSPRAGVTVVDASPDEYQEYVNAVGDCHALCFDEDLPFLTVKALSYGTRYDGKRQAQSLFSALLQLDQAGAERVLAHIPSKNGIGLAVYNRLIRSAGFQTVNPKGHHIIGLTGGSGAGKTTVSKTLEELGCAVIDCDKVTREPDVYDEECLKELAEAFGNEILENGVLNRKKLASVALPTKESRQKLGDITFPRILRRLLEKINAEKLRGKRLIVIDAPTLFESGFDRYCSRIVAVTAGRETRLQRILSRDGITPQEAEKRLRAQHDDSFFVSRADHVVGGEGGYDLKKRLLPIVRGLMEKTGNAGVT